MAEEKNEKEQPEEKYVLNSYVYFIVKNPNFTVNFLLRNHFIQTASFQLQ